MSAHGTYARYNAGCRDDCCRTAARRYHKQRVYERDLGLPREIDSIGVRRRLQALMCLGWDAEEIARRLGVSHSRVQKLRNQVAPVRRSTLERVDAVYNELAMTPGPTDHMGNWLRAKAKRLGYAPPLAWDNDTIDDPDARPNRSGRGSLRDLDHAAIRRRMHGDRSVRLRNGEAAELVRLCRAAGWNEARIEALGVKPERYKTEDAA
jgi:transcriptional regulator with XRE-family HTH domain